MAVLVYYLPSTEVQKRNAETIQKRGDYMPWDLDSDRPIFMQILERIQMDIVSGKYQPGEKLPSVRELAAEAAVNPNTVQRAYAELERTGLVYSQRTSGRFITEDEAMIQELRAETAKEKIQAFLKSMEQLGFDKEKTLAMMRQAMEMEQ